MLYRKKIVLEMIYWYMFENIQCMHIKGKMFIIMIKILYQLRILDTKSQANNKDKLGKINKMQKQEKHFFLI